MREAVSALLVSAIASLIVLTVFGAATRLVWPPEPELLIEAGARPAPPPTPKLAVPPKAAPRPVPPAVPRVRLPIEPFDRFRPDNRSMA